ncbi:ATP-binding protein [Streptomyces sioyaensis]|uniref:ATP-binding protein n=1 Tax=Streptomyces sioyaensis TaxID=67364 RepID=UPI003665A181
MHKEIRALCARTAFYRRERRSVPRAREFVRAALAAWDLDHLAHDVLLCVSELATNALLHGVPPGRGYRLVLALDEDGLLRVEVHDSGDGTPRAPAPYDRDGEESEFGRGLLLVSGRPPPGGGGGGGGRGVSLWGFRAGRDGFGRTR